MGGPFLGLIRSPSEIHASQANAGFASYRVEQIDNACFDIQCRIP
jgi:hypothetical protein